MSVLVFVSVRGLSLVAASGGHSSSRCAGLSLSRLLLLRSTGSRCTGSAVVAHGPSCSAACGIFPDQGSNPCPLHWQADSQPLRHQGSPYNSSSCAHRRHTIHLGQQQEGKKVHVPTDLSTTPSHLGKYKEWSSGWKANLKINRHHHPRQNCIQPTTPRSDERGE